MGLEVIDMAPRIGSEIRTDVRTLLARLRDWATRPCFVFRHEWQPGDLLIWSNTGTMHRALPYPLDSGRLMHRTILAGEEPLQ